MLPREENELFTRVGPGTPMGNAMRSTGSRRCCRSELAEADGPPLRVRLLGENLVAFRDTNGKFGLLDEFCPHRRRRCSSGATRSAGCAASTTAGSSTSTATASTCPTSRPTPTSSTSPPQRPIRRELGGWSGPIRTGRQVAAGAEIRLDPGAGSSRRGPLPG